MTILLVTTTIYALSDLITEAGTQYSREATHPSFDADRMDTRLKFFSERLKRLRELRQQFEDEMMLETP